MTFGLTVLAASLLTKGDLNLIVDQSSLHSVYDNVGLQDPPARQGRAGQGGSGPGEQGGGAAKSDFASAVKDYVKQEGVVNAFTKGDSILFEIPEALLGRDFLWYIEDKTTASGGYSGSGLNQGVIRFEKRGEKVFVRQMSYAVRAKNGERMMAAVEGSNVQPIIQALDVKATSEHNGLLVDVSRMFVNGIPEFRGGPSSGSVDASRSYVESVKVFPENLNIEVVRTTTSGGGAPAGGGGRLGGAPQRPSNTGSINHSIVLLPAKPMSGRLSDSRVGYFSDGFMVYDGEGQGTEEFSYINRYRLEKKDPNAAMSEPVKPIVYYVSREVPEIWREYVKQGIEDWQPAFEQAGFKNAIIAKDAPSKAEDPNWDPEDVRYSVIRWAPLPIANALGPSVTDPRSGEILSGHVIIWHDVLKLAVDWYFSQASASDPKARKLPFPTELTGELLRFVVAHEVGHTLGLPHNGKSSAMVPTELLRDAKWTAENGTAPSIMDYARFNYVAQPGDGARLIPMVGAYDKFSIKWGYSPITAASPEDEVSTLDAWAGMQVENPMLRFYDNFNGADPTAQSEALGDDAVVASTYGVMNLKRMMGYLLPGTSKFGKDYSDLARWQGALSSQFSRYIGHVTAMVGGVVETDYHAGRGNNVYTPVPADRQKAAVAWLLDNATPTWLIPQDVVAKLGASSGFSQVSGVQSRVISSLLNNARLQRMIDNETMNGGRAYTVTQMLNDIRASVWSELTQASPVVNVYRRSMQRAMVNALISKLSSPASDIRSYATAEIRREMSLISASMPKVKDDLTREHLNDLMLLMDQSLKFPPTPEPAAATSTFPFGLNSDEMEWCGCGIMPQKSHSQSFSDWLKKVQG